MAGRRSEMCEGRELPRAVLTSANGRFSPPALGYECDRPTPSGCEGSPARCQNTEVRAGRKHPTDNYYLEIQRPIHRSRASEEPGAMTQVATRPFEPCPGRSVAGQRCDVARRAASRHSGGAVLIAPSLWLDRYSSSGPMRPVQPPSTSGTVAVVPPSWLRFGPSCRSTCMSRRLYRNGCSVTDRSKCSKLEYW